MKEEQLQFIREKCIEANPTIKSTYHESTGNNLRCKNCGESDNYENVGTCKKGKERPIRLADVVQAIHQVKDREWLKYSYILNKWNLLKDDLTTQSAETISFIYELLHE